MHKGGGECSLDNMQTLCVPCHLKKSGQEAMERAREKREEKEREKEREEKGDRWERVREMVAKGRNRETSHAGK